VGPKHERERIEAELGPLAIQSKKEVKSLGVILDCDLNFKSHINGVTKTCFYHLRNIAKIRSFSSLDDAK